MTGEPLTGCTLPSTSPTLTTSLAIPGIDDKQADEFPDASDGEWGSSLGREAGWKLGWGRGVFEVKWEGKCLLASCTGQTVDGATEPAPEVRCSTGEEGEKDVMAGLSLVGLAWLCFLHRLAFDVCNSHLDRSHLLS